MNASILLVEDDAAEARRLEAALIHLGHRATLAGDGDAALARLGSERFDLVLLDLVLPGLDGMGVLCAMAARGIATPVVVAASPAGLDGARSALKAGAKDFVVKPAGALRLEVAIRNALALAGRDIAHPDPAARTGALPARGRPDAAGSDPEASPEAATAFEHPLPHAPLRPAASRPAAGGRVIAWPAPAGEPSLPAEPAGADVFLDPGGHVRPLEAIEAQAIGFALALYGGRMSEAARHLGIGRSTLYRKLAALGALGALGAPLPEPYAPAFVAAE